MLIFISGLIHADSNVAEHL